MNIAVIMTVHNRRDKTIRCLESLGATLDSYSGTVNVSVFLTDDGCTDGTVEGIRSHRWPFPVNILPGDGNLFWNAGMINSWKAAMADGNWDGYLWLNDDVVVLPEFWKDLQCADDYCIETYGKRGIYVGSAKDEKTGILSYGGFIYTNKITLKDKFMIPDGKSFQTCEAAHGNITYVSSEVVQSRGILCEKYFHGGADHDYTYLAHKAGVPILVLPHFSAYCENDHGRLTVPKPIADHWVHNRLLFAKRCFPWRYPLVLLSIFGERYFPNVQGRIITKAKSFG